MKFKVMTGKVLVVAFLTPKRPQNKGFVGWFRKGRFCDIIRVKLRKSLSYIRKIHTDKRSFL